MAAVSKHLLPASLKQVGWKSKFVPNFGPKKSLNFETINTNSSQKNSNRTIEEPSFIFRDKMNKTTVNNLKNFLQIWRKTNLQIWRKVGQKYRKCD